MNTKLFSSLKLDSALLKNLSTLGYKVMTPIQEKSLPHILEGRDVIGQGKTGSGKTAAFGLGLLQNLKVKRFRVQTLVLCPTRELADQVAKEIRRLARAIHNIKVLTICGGMPFGPQIGSLEHGAHIIVGTPGRVDEHIRKRNLKLWDINTLVLDEADRMLDMGFQETLDAIIEKVPEKRQTLLFSATFPAQIQSIAESIMDNPIRVEVASTHDSSSIKQFFFKIDSNQERLTALRLLLLKNNFESTLVFCNTKIETQNVADELCNSGFSSLALHGDLDQKARNQTLVRFANKSASILVATDVAARGLDIESLDAVINYHFAHEPEDHLHRIGRTGRVDAKGIACTLYLSKEKHKINRLESFLNQDLEDTPIPHSGYLGKPPFQPPMVTLQIDGGKKQKVRPGDILGALTGKEGIAGSKVGKIDIFDLCAFVAVDKEVANQALKKIKTGQLKGRSFRVRIIK